MSHRLTEIKRYPLEIQKRHILRVNMMRFSRALYRIFNLIFRPLLSKLDDQYTNLMSKMDFLRQSQESAFMEQADRIEFIRNELFYEMAKNMNGSTSKVQTQIINQEKFDCLVKAKQLVLNVGCGHHPIESMINVDMRKLPGVDLVADAENIELPEKSVQGIYSSHVLEHFSHEKLRRKILPNWVRLLKSEGEFRAVVPDAEAMLEAYAKGFMIFEDLRMVTFGAQEYEGDFHFNMFSRESLKDLLEEAGLRNVGYQEVGRRNGLCFEMEIVALK